jgi:hypothetical protein
MKAFKQVWKSLTGVPAVSFADKRYTFVNYDANGKIVTATAAGVSVGIIEEPNGIDEPAQVIASGFSFVVFGGAVASGQEVEVGANGRAVVLAGGRSAGIAAVGGAAAGDIGTVLLK